MKLREGFILGSLIGATVAGPAVFVERSTSISHERSVRAGNNFARAVRCGQAIDALKGIGVATSQLKKDVLGARAKNICESSD